MQLVSNSKGRVYRSKRTRRVFACLLSTGRRTLLDQPPDTVVYPPPAIDLTGYYVGYAIEGTDDPEGEEDTIMQVRDLRTSDTPAFFGDAYATSRTDFYDAKVGSVRIRPNGSMAWIACRTRDNIPEEWGDPRPSCVRAGANDEVRIMSAGESRPRTLQIGHAIDPRSLRLRDGRISWTSRGRTRSAPLP